MEPKILRKVEWGKRSDSTQPKKQAKISHPISTPQQINDSNRNGIFRLDEMDPLSPSMAFFEETQEIPSLESIASISAFEEEEPLSEITGTYSDDFNILKIDDIIYRRFRYQRDKRIASIKQRIQIENENLSLPRMYLDQKQSREIIKKLTETLEELISERDISQYSEESTQYIDAYKELGIKPKIISFRNDVDPIVLDDKMIEKMKEEYRYRHEIIDKYLEIAKKYIHIDVLRIISGLPGCPVCGYIDEIDVINEEEEHDTMACSQCGAEKSSLHYSVTFENGTQSTSRKGYEDRENFYKAFLRFQGKEQNRLPDHLFGKLDAYFSSYDLPTMEKALSLPFTTIPFTTIPFTTIPFIPNGNLSFKIKEGTSRELMWAALSKTGNAAYYENSHLICSLYWGWICPDLSHLEETVMFIYDETQAVFEKLPRTRKSNINVQYRLFKTLHMIQCPYIADDFKMIKTRTILEEYDKTWKEMVEGAAINNKNKKLQFQFRFYKTI